MSEINQYQFNVSLNTLMSINGDIKVKPITIEWQCGSESKGSMLFEGKEDNAAVLSPTNGANFIIQQQMTKTRITDDIYEYDKLHIILTLKDEENLESLIKLNEIVDNNIDKSSFSHIDSIEFCNSNNELLYMLEYNIDVKLETKSDNSEKSNDLNDEIKQDHDDQIDIPNKEVTNTTTKPTQPIDEPNHKLEPNPDLHLQIVLLYCFQLHNGTLEYDFSKSPIFVPNLTYNNSITSYIQNLSKSDKLTQQFSTARQIIQEFLNPFFESQQNSRKLAKAHSALMKKEKTFKASTLVKNMEESLQLHYFNNMKNVSSNFFTSILVTKQLNSTFDGYHTLVKENYKNQFNALFLKLKPVKVNNVQVLQKKSFLKLLTIQAPKQAVAKKIKPTIADYMHFKMNNQDDVTEDIFLEYFEGKREEEKIQDDNIGEDNIEDPNSLGIEEVNVVVDGETNDIEDENISSKKLEEESQIQKSENQEQDTKNIYEVPNKYMSIQCLFLLSLYLKNPFIPKDIILKEFKDNLEHLLLSDYETINSELNDYTYFPNQPVKDDVISYFNHLTENYPYNHEEIIAQLDIADNLLDVFLIPYTLNGDSKAVKKLEKKHLKLLKSEKLFSSLFHIYIQDSQLQEYYYLNIKSNLRPNFIAEIWMLNNLLDAHIAYRDEIMSNGNFEETFQSINPIKSEEGKLCLTNKSITLLFSKIKPSSVFIKKNLPLVSCYIFSYLSKNEKVQVDLKRWLTYCESEAKEENEQTKVAPSITITNGELKKPKEKLVEEPNSEEESYEIPMPTTPMNDEYLHGDKKDFSDGPLDDYKFKHFHSDNEKDPHPIVYKRLTIELDEAPKLKPLDSSFLLTPVDAKPNLTPMTRNLLKQFEEFKDSTPDEYNDSQLDLTPMSKAILKDLEKDTNSNFEMEPMTPMSQTESVLLLTPHDNITFDDQSFSEPYTPVNLTEPTEMISDFTFEQRGNNNEELDIDIPITPEDPSINEENDKENIIEEEGEDNQYMDNKNTQKDDEYHQESLDDTNENNVIDSVENEEIPESIEDFNLENKSVKEDIINSDEDAINTKNKQDIDVNQNIIEIEEKDVKHVNEEVIEENLENETEENQKEIEENDILAKKEEIEDIQNIEDNQNVDKNEDNGNEELVTPPEIESEIKEINEEDTIINKNEENEKDEIIESNVDTEFVEEENEIDGIEDKTPIEDKENNEENVKETNEAIVTDEVIETKVTEEKTSNINIEEKDESLIESENHSLKADESKPQIDDEEESKNLDADKNDEILITIENTDEKSEQVDILNNEEKEEEIKETEEINETEETGKIEEEKKEKIEDKKVQDTLDKKEKKIDEKSSNVVATNQNIENTPKSAIDDKLSVGTFTMNEMSVDEFTIGGTKKKKKKRGLFSRFKKTPTKVLKQLLKKNSLIDDSPQLIDHLQVLCSTPEMQIVTASTLYLTGSNLYFTIPKKKKIPSVLDLTRDISIEISGYEIILISLEQSKKYNIHFKSLEDLHIWSARLGPFVQNNPVSEDKKEIEEEKQEENKQEEKKQDEKQEESTQEEQEASTEKDKVQENLNEKPQSEDKIENNSKTENIAEQIEPSIEPVEENKEIEKEEKIRPEDLGIYEAKPNPQIPHELPSTLLLPSISYLDQSVNFDLKDKLVMTLLNLYDSFEILFDKIDDNGNGEISRSEFVNGMKKLVPITATSSQYLTLYSEMDLEDYGGLYKSSFIEYLQRYKLLLKVKQQLLKHIEEKFEGDLYAFFVHLGGEENPINYFTYLSYLYDHGFYKSNPSLDPYFELLFLHMDIDHSNNLNFSEFSKPLYSLQKIARRNLQKDSHKKDVREYCDHEQITLGQLFDKIRGALLFLPPQVYILKMKKLQISNDDSLLKELFWGMGGYDSGTLTKRQFVNGYGGDYEAESNLTIDPIENDFDIPEIAPSKGEPQLNSTSQLLSPSYFPNDSYVKPMLPEQPKKTPPQIEIPELGELQFEKSQTRLEMEASEAYEDNTEPTVEPSIMLFDSYATPRLLSSTAVKEKMLFTKGEQTPNLIPKQIEIHEDPITDEIVVKLKKEVKKNKPTVEKIQAMLQKKEDIIRLKKKLIDRKEEQQQALSRLEEERKKLLEHLKMDPFKSSSPLDRLVEMAKDYDCVVDDIDTPYKYDQQSLIDDLKDIPKNKSKESDEKIELLKLDPPKEKALFHDDYESPTIRRQKDKHYLLNKKRAPEDFEDSKVADEIIDMVKHNPTNEIKYSGPDQIETHTPKSPVSTRASSKPSTPTVASSPLPSPSNVSNTPTGTPEVDPHKEEVKKEEEQEVNENIIDEKPKEEIIPDDEDTNSPSNSLRVQSPISLKPSSPVSPVKEVIQPKEEDDMKVKKQPLNNNYIEDNGTPSLVPPNIGASRFGRSEKDISLWNPDKQIIPVNSLTEPTKPRKLPRSMRRRRAQPDEGVPSTPNSKGNVFKKPERDLTALKLSQDSVKKDRVFKVPLNQNFVQPEPIRSLSPDNEPQNIDKEPLHSPRYQPSSPLLKNYDKKPASPVEKEETSIFKKLSIDTSKKSHKKPFQKAQSVAQIQMNPSINSEKYATRFNSFQPSPIPSRQSFNEPENIYDIDFEIEKTPTPGTPRHGLELSSDGKALQDEIYYQLLLQQLTCREFHAKLDIDNTQLVSCPQFLNGIKKCLLLPKAYMSNKNIKHLFKFMDGDDDGVLDPSEFENSMNLAAHRINLIHHSKRLSSKNEAYQHFLVLARKMDAMRKSIFLNQDYVSLRDRFRELDRDGNQQISWSEFEAYFQSDSAVYDRSITARQALRTLFLSADRERRGYIEFIGFQRVIIDDFEKSVTSSFEEPDNKPEQLSVANVAERHSMMPLHSNEKKDVIRELTSPRSRTNHSFARALSSSSSFNPHNLSSITSPNDSVHSLKDDPNLERVPPRNDNEFGLSNMTSHLTLIRKPRGVGRDKPSSTTSQSKIIDLEDDEAHELSEKTYNYGENTKNSNFLKSFYSDL